MRDITNNMTLLEAIDLGVARAPEHIKKEFERLEQLKKEQENIPHNSLNNYNRPNPYNPKT